MGRAKCRCIACVCSAEAAIGATEEIRGVSHNHARLPGVLRYRGLENEAAMAARLVNVETLVCSLRSVLEDLDDPIAAWVASPAIVAEDGFWIAGNDAPEFAPRTLARQHVQLVEGLLETAFLKIYSDLASAGESPAQSPIG